MQAAVTVRGDTFTGGTDMPFDVVVMVTLALAALVFAVGVSVLECVL